MKPHDPRRPVIPQEPVFGPDGPKTHYERVLAARRNLARHHWAWEEHLEKKKTP